MCILSLAINRNAIIAGKCEYTDPSSERVHLGTISNIHNTAIVRHCAKWTTLTNKNVRHDEVKPRVSSYDTIMHAFYDRELAESCAICGPADRQEPGGGQTILS